MTISPQQAVEAVRDDLRNVEEPMRAYWMCIDGDRARYRAEVRAVRRDAPIVPIVVRSGFENPNALFEDLMLLLESARRDVEEIMAAGTGAIGILLLARVELELPQVGSPARFPEWFPMVGGSDAHVLIRNVVTTATATLSDPECRVDELCSLLHQLERALLNRLERSFRQDHTSGAALFELLRDSKVVDESYRTFLESARISHDAVTEASAFRPSARDGRSLVGRLMRLCGATSPDGLYASAKALSRALDLEHAEQLRSTDSLVSVLLRGTVRDTRRDIAYARNIVVSMFAASQWVTAAAHADQYPRYLILSLRGLSYDLRATISGLCEDLEAAPDR